ncbi:MAG: IS5/IS1182 family transposase, partial [Ottowia sp.]
MHQRRSALKSDLFADYAHKRKIDVLGDPLELIARHIDFDHLGGLIDDLYPRTDGA